MKENQFNLKNGVKSGVGYNKKISSFLYSLFRIWWYLGKFKIWRLFLRFIYKFVPNRYCVDLLNNIKPDLVFISSINPSDLKLLQQAKRRKLKTVQMIKSWDNLTSKTFLATIPDFLIVHNEVMKNEAIVLDDMLREKIFISGIPQFDYLVKNREKLEVARKDFYKKLKINPNKKVILFCASGDWLNPYEEEILKDLYYAIKEGRVIDDVQIHIRMHPKYQSNFDEIEKISEFTMDRPFTYLDKNNFNSWIFQEEEIEHWYNSIYHSSMVINTASSISIDAAVLDRPIICIGFDGKEKLSYEHSVLRFYSRDHYANLIKTKGIDLVKNNDELIESINKYLKDLDCKKEERKMLVKQQCYNLDGKSSLRIADFIKSKL